MKAVLCRGLSRILPEGYPASLLSFWSARIIWKNPFFSLKRYSITSFSKGCGYFIILQLKVRKRKRNKIKTSFPTVCPEFVKGVNNISKYSEISLRPRAHRTSLLRHRKHKALRYLFFFSGFKIVINHSLSL